MLQALQTGTLFFLGMFVGATLFGRIADRIGRRKVLLLTVTCDVGLGIARSLPVISPRFWRCVFWFGTAVGAHAARRLRHDGRVPAAAKPYAIEPG